MRWFILVLAALASACAASITGPDAPDSQTHAAGPEEGERVRVMGAIAGFNQDDPRIEIEPRNANFLVKVTTYGAGCHSQGEMEVVIDGLDALLTPYDYTEPPGTFCTMQLVTFTHEAVVDFHASGTATIRVQGLDRSRASAENLHGEPIIVEFTVTVPARP